MGKQSQPAQLPRDLGSLDDEQLGQAFDERCKLNLELMDEKDQIREAQLELNDELTAIADERERRRLEGPFDEDAPEQAIGG